ncbi:MAG: lipid-A-disaccharide synthase N-terminal domain-containing protein [Desulfobacteraceae bacterium]|nr:lipid-A-disaccharide synthase N-terminal domain-containing protein [Desulfobacteraceae bacterium]
MNPETFWVGVGMLGQGLFSMRFVIQWLSSERKGRSVIPVAFWFFSIGGGINLLFYAVYRKDPVFIIGQGTGLLIYFRNLYFVFRESRVSREEPA